MEVNPARRSAMTLYSDPRDHYSHRVRLVLAEKGIAVDVVDVNPSRMPRRLADVNPDNTVPTLVDRELALYRSEVIMEYLDERFPHPPLLPVYPVSRAHSRLLMYRIEKDWCVHLNVLASGKGGARVLNKAHVALRESIVAAAPAFGEKPYFLNDEFSLVDCCVAPVLWRLEHVEIDLPERQTRPLVRYMQKIFARQSFRDSLTELEMEMRD